MKMVRMMKMKMIRGETFTLVETISNMKLVYLKMVGLMKMKQSPT